MKEKMRARRTADKGCCIVIVAFVSLVIFGRQARRQAERREEEEESRTPHWKGGIPLLFAVLRFLCTQGEWG